jgi:hypothetical protein
MEQRHKSIRFDRLPTALVRLDVAIATVLTLMALGFLLGLFIAP